jgi:hypothetical protein
MSDTRGLMKKVDVIAAAAAGSYIAYEAFHPRAPNLPYSITQQSVILPGMNYSKLGYLWG